MIAANESFVFLAIPFFTCAGVIFNYSGITRKLMNLADAMMGHMVGGLGHVNILMSGLMGGLSGSALADTALGAKMIVPEMERLGYSKAYSCAVTASSSCVTPIIPPGIILILYAAAANVSVARLFFAGYLPGILMLIAMLFVNHIISTKRQYKANRERKATGKEVLRALREAVWALLVPFGIIMGLRFGAFTPTEAGAVSIVYAIVIGVFFYRELKFKHIIPILKESLIATAGIMFILNGAQAFSLYLTWERIPMMISETIVQSVASPLGFLLLVNVMLLILGLFFDGGAAMILMAPLLVPAAAALDINLIQFGIIMCVNLTLGSITPPFGAQMFCACTIANCRLEDYTKEVLPYVFCLLIVLLFLTYVPSISLFIPNLLL
jgi:tripartite ATP-independent transporter DctM subunit